MWFHLCEDGFLVHWPQRKANS